MINRENVNILVVDDDKNLTEILRDYLTNIGYSLGFDVIPRLVGRMKAYHIEEFLMDIGTVDSYEKAQMIWPQTGAD